MSVEELMSRLAVLEHSLGPGLSVIVDVNEDDRPIGRVYEEQMNDGRFVVVIEGQS